MLLFPRQVCRSGGISVSVHGVPLSSKDFLDLGQGRLGDAPINAFLACLQSQRNSQRNSLFNTFWFTKITEPTFDPSRADSWIQKVTPNDHADDILELINFAVVDSKYSNRDCPDKHPKCPLVVRCGESGRFRGGDV